MAHRGPGLRKAGKLPLVQQRALILFQCSDYRIRELFEAADVLSEGALQSSQAVATYYGSTSILLPLASLGGMVADEDAIRACSLLASNPHARTRAVRIACREAQVRCHRLGRLHAELRFELSASGIQISVDVEAPYEQDDAPHKDNSSLSASLGRRV